MAQAVWAKRDALTTMNVTEIDMPPLADGAVRLKVQSFAVTANNVTYAVIGDMFQYWSFFPAPDGWGIVPMWGHATVEASNCPDLAVGERIYGYLPMGTHLDVMPVGISAGGFTDGAAHRQPMSMFYNQYSRLAADPEHDPANEDARMIYGPLFKTGFLIEDFYRRNDWFGADTLILSSASSKTALALAHCAKLASPNVRRIGLTSSGNVAFVKASGLYDDVVAYEDVAALAPAASVFVDFAGNAKLVHAVHTALGDHLKYSSTVGATHVGAQGSGGAPLPGPQPVLFFAPTEALETIKALSPAGFAKAVGGAWASFVASAKGFMKVEHRDGLAAATEVFQATLMGQQNPDTGVVVRP